MPNDILYTYLEQYGEILSSFIVKKRILGKVIQIGTRVVQFNSLKGPIPKIIRFANRNIRVIHIRDKKTKKKIIITNKPKTMN